MKKFIIVLLAVLLAAPLANAGRKTKKTGNVKDDVFTDSRFNFKLTSLENWTAKVIKEDDDTRIRVIFTQKKPAIPSHYQQTPHYTQTPRLVIYVDTTTLGVFPFVDSLLSETFESDQKKTIKSEFNILNQREIIPTGRRGFEFAGERGMAWTGRADYTQEVLESASSAGGKRVSGAYAGAIIGGKFGDKVFLAGLFCEFDFFESILTEAGVIVQSLEWLENKDKKE